MLLNTSASPPASRTPSTRSAYFLRFDTLLMRNSLSAATAAAAAAHSQNGVMKDINMFIQRDRRAGIPKGQKHTRRQHTAIWVCHSTIMHVCRLWVPSARSECPTHAKHHCHLG
jgi:hypothetical protein